MNTGVFDTFRQVATRLTGNPSLQKDLMQEMYVHLLDVRTNKPGMDVAVYVRSCEMHAYDYYERVKSRYTAVPTAVGVAGFGDISISSDQLTQVLPQLSPRQQEVFARLRQGCGVRETARQLGISHPAVIKHRRKIVTLLQDLQQTIFPAPCEALPLANVA